MKSKYFSILLGILLFFPAQSVQDQFERPAWGYECQAKLCKKIKLTDQNVNTLLSLDVCRMICSENEIGTLWPKPLSPEFKKILEVIDPANIEFQLDVYLDPKYWNGTKERFQKQIDAKKSSNYELKSGGKKLKVEVVLSSNNLQLNKDIMEDHNIEFSNSTETEVNYKISSDSFYGIRHAIETLSQLIVYDDINNNMKLLGEGLSITDNAKYKHRGLMLDTSRNFYSIESIKRTIDAMAMVKLNVFHWHITDSHSFPMVIPKQPELSELGAYSPEQVYTPEDIKDIVEFAKIRGIRVIPEFDAPAHVGEGWQNTNLTTCFAAQPWTEFCKEPPCGQLDPTKNELYNVLENIYRGYWESFGPMDFMHMGGDEIVFNCWNSSKEIQEWMLNKGWKLDEEGFMNLWGYFQENALQRLDMATQRKLPVILWTSTLTDPPYLTKFLNKDRYIIQVWSKGDDPVIKTLIDANFNIIMSNYDAFYLDCGFGGWVTDGNNWCTPYKGWQVVYDNRINKQFPVLKRKLLFGAEAALWSEQTDENTIDSRLWPRLSAFAERLWSDPPASMSWKNADSRMMMHHKRLVENGIYADRLQPEWCLQNERECNTYEV